MTSITRAPSTISVINLTGQTDFNVPFDYLARKFVIVTLLGADRRVLTLNTDYRFVTKTSISLAISTPAGYDKIEIRRVTSAARLVDFQDGSILRALDMNTSQLQSLHISEEARDAISFDGMGITDEGNLDARGRRILNVAFAQDERDAVPLGQIRQFDSSALASAAKAEQEANRAETEANRAEAAYNANAAAIAPLTAAINAKGSPMLSNSHKYKVVHSIKHQFDGYAGIIAAGGYSYLYATGHSYDYKANELWVSYQANGGDTASYWVVYDLSTMVQKTWFKAGKRWTKSFFLHYTADSKRWLYARGSTTYLVKFDVTVLPTVGTEVAEQAGPRANLSALAVSKLGDLMAVGYRGPTTNTTTYFNTVSLVDVNTWETKQAYRLNTVAAGDTDGVNDYSYKTQGMCLVPTGVAIAHGGIVSLSKSYSDGDFRVFQGVVLRDPQGGPLASGLFDPFKAAPILRAAGLTVTRTEFEGVNYAEETGKITSLVHIDDAPDSSYLIVEVFSDAPDAINLAPAAVSLATNVPEVASLFRNDTDALVDPVLGTPLLDVGDVCLMMNRWDMRETEWYSTNFNTMTFNGSTIPGSLRCKLFRGTPTTFYFEIMSSGAFKQYALTNPSSSGVTVQQIRSL